MKTRKSTVPQIFPQPKSLLAGNVDAIADQLGVPFNAERKADLAKRLESIEYQYQFWCYEQASDRAMAKGHQEADSIRKRLSKALSRIYGRSFESIVTDKTQESAAKRGRSADIALRKLVEALMQVYKDFTGRPLGTSVDQKTGEPGGPLIRFVRQCLSNLGIDKSRQAIRTLIRRILAH